METKEKNVTRKFDLEERSFLFAKNVRAFTRELPRSVASIEDTKQLVRSSGSVGANYIEANECVGKKDFVLRIRIARKEAKESKYWLRLIETHTADLEKRRAALEQEATELMPILSSIMRKYV